MKNIWKYLLIFLGVFFIALLVAVPLLGVFTGRMHSGWDMGMRIPGRSFGMGPAFGGLGLLWMGGRLLFNLAIVALAVVGVVLLVRRSRGVQAAATRPCPHCGRPVQSGWVACPSCGERIPVVDATPAAEPAVVDETTQAGEELGEEPSQPDKDQNS